MMTEALETGATVTALRGTTDPNVAWNRYCSLMKRADGDQALLLDRDFCTELARSWIVFRELMGVAQ